VPSEKQAHTDGHEVRSHTKGYPCGYSVPYSSLLGWIRGERRLRVAKRNFVTSQIGSWAGGEGRCAGWYLSSNRREPNREADRERHDLLHVAMSGQAETVADLNKATAGCEVLLVLQDTSPRLSKHSATKTVTVQRTTATHPTSPHARSALSAQPYQAYHQTPRRPLLNIYITNTQTNVILETSYAVQRDTISLDLVQALRRREVARHS